MGRENISAFVVALLLFVSTSYSQDCSQKTSSFERDRCWSKVGIDSKDSTTCEKIQNNESKLGCFSGIAVGTHEPTVCNRLHDGHLQDLCFVYAAGRLKDSTICPKIQDQRLVDECMQNSTLQKVTDRAIENKEPSSCERIADLSRKQQCYLSLAKATKTYSLCEQSGWSDECKVLIAQEHGDSSICPSLGTLESKNDCFFKVGQKLNDVLYCRKIEQNDQKKDICIVAVAKGLQNLSLCSQVTNPTLQNVCKSSR